MEFNKFNDRGIFDTFVEIQEEYSFMRKFEYYYNYKV